MDFLVKHWGAYARRFPSPLPVANVDFIRNKNHWIRRSFDTCDFSLILRGRGQFNRLGRSWEVVAPCVITQWPGEHVEYGPPMPDETWDELYVVYDAGLMGRLKEARLVDPNKPVWPIHDAAMVHGLVAELSALACSPEPEAVVDRVDRVCERLVLETWLTRPQLEKDAAPLQAVLTEVRRSFATDVDYERLAQRHGMSASTFRRRWAEVMSVPPARYLQELRMREACRMLVETNRAIHEIAGAVGFADELYFSRRFRQELRMAPRDYRKAYQIGRR